LGNVIAAFLFALIKSNIFHKRENVEFLEISVRRCSRSYLGCFLVLLRYSRREF